MKRGKNSGRRFGFVRFDCPVFADIAVEKANGIRLLGNIIYVKHAAFNTHGLPSNKPGILLSQGGNAYKPLLTCFSPLRTETRIALDSQIVLGFCPYAKVVFGSVQRQIPRVQACDEGNEWLSRSVVGRLSAMRDLDSLLEAFISEGVTNIQLRDLGGTLVLLSFELVEHMSSMLEEAGLCWLRNCKASCSCKGCGIDNVVSYPRPYGESDSDTEKEDDFFEDSVKDLSREVASDGVHIQISKDDVELSLHSINNFVIGDSCSPMGVDQAGEDIRIGE
ncbi:hypothetical protein Vadar_001541 [Vaccinium darrowii]|uniref:Uncharacterized protein n=1 Tax=Vaccinium darrowii TaxID=229202 RepID=A0ACB7YT90_9ERIC|nr:hypothetical protein Vadar_001541 [Vaccinium darrowii]